MKIKLPVALARTSLFRRGAILKTTLALTTTTKEKYLIVVSLSESSDPVFAVITTSKVAWHARNPGHGAPIPAGTVSAFERDTVVDCRKLYSLTMSDILARYASHHLEYCGQLPPSVLEQITEALAASPVLTPIEKGMVVPANGDP